MQNTYKQIRKYLTGAVREMFQPRQGLNTIFLSATTFFTIRNLITKKTKPILYGPLYPK